MEQDRAWVFSHITRNWQGVPLESVEVVVQLIGATQTREGLEVHAWLDEGQYQKGRKVTDQELEEIHIRPSAFHGEWNYEILPRFKRTRKLIVAQRLKRDQDEPADHALGNSRGRFTTRTHLLVDANGHPLGFHLTG